METSTISESKAKLNRPYALAVVSLTILLPALSVFLEWKLRGGPLTSLALTVKWFIFWAVGVRQFTAGLRQVINPAFTAKDIFHIEDTASHTIVKELGFANICFGAVGIISLFLPAWRIVSAFGSGLFFGIAGINHIAKKPASPNEALALVSDLFIFVGLLLFVAEQTSGIHG
jgi:hypothetical protein